MTNRTYVYIDAFNLYYGAIKGTNHKWLNIYNLCKQLLPKNDIVKIKYFTALVGARKADQNQPVRQKIYIRALETTPCLKIYYGHFLTHDQHLPLVKPIGRTHFAHVYRTEEKGSDVNLATHLLYDAYKNNYDIAVIISNDSDLFEAIKIVKEDFGKTIGMLNSQNHPSKKLLPLIDFYKPIRAGVLQASPFPNNLKDEKGKFHKPEEW